MRWSELFRLSARALRDGLPAELQSLHWEPRHGMAKAWYGNRDIHYELWWRGRLHVLELGLHFESDALTNARLLAAFRSRASEVHRDLGDGARIEEWDKGWARVWEPFSLELPNAELRQRVPARLVDYVRTLEPILREELPNDVEWAPPASVPTRRTRRAAR